MIERIHQHHEFYAESHRWDNRLNRHHDWEGDFMQRSTSGYIRLNPLTGPFVRALNPLMALILESAVLVRNWRNWRVESRYNDHAM